MKNDYDFWIMMIESLRWPVHGDYGWRLIDDGWLRSLLIITENDLSLFMIIIIDVLHNYFNFDDYHDGWLIDHMIMTIDRDYHLCWLIHVDCYWLIMMMNMTDDLLIVIYHEWRLIIMIIDDLSLLIMTGHGWWLISRLSDWLIDWWQDHDNKICHDAKSQQSI